MNYFPRAFSKLLLILLVLIPLKSSSQKKIGHVNSQALLDTMPEMQIAKSKIDSIGKAYNKQLQQLQQRYEIAYNEGDDDEAKRVELRLYTFKNAVDSEIEAKSEVLFKPIRDKVKKAIQDVAAEEGYDLILDNAYDAIVVYGSKKSDITEAVQKKLGL